MEVEHDVKVIPVNDGLPAELEKLSKQGWALVPGVQPVAIYHVVRQKGAETSIAAFVPTVQPATAAIGVATMTIDESKIGILRNGQII